MDDRRFDTLARQLACGRSRRSVLRGLLGLGSASLAGSVTTQRAEAARRPAPTPKPPTCPGQQQWDGNDCVCPGGFSKCGPDCCPESQAQCCDNACCYGTCYGEELCCPTGSSVCGGTACCAPGKECVDGQCQSCTPCGELCCSAPNATCCQTSFGSSCVPAGSSCCSSDSDCFALGYCDDIILHEFSCNQGVCVDNPQSCQGDDPCVDYACDSGRRLCMSSTTLECCRNNDECDPVDACTPALCMDNHRCNTVPVCTVGLPPCAQGECDPDLLACRVTIACPPS